MAVVKFRKGSVVSVHGRNAKITRIVDVDAVMVQDSETSEVSQVRVGLLALPRPKTALPIPIPADELPPERHERALRIRDAIKAIRKAPKPTNALWKEHADNLEMSSRTLRRCAERYEAIGTLSSVLPPRRNGGRGKSRVSAEAEAMMTAVIEDYYLVRPKKSVARTHRELATRCRTAGIKPAPHLNTLRKRIKSLSPELVMRKLEGSKAARYRYGPIRGHFPGADYPLSILQIDHTKLDLSIVDSVHRLPIGRCNITIAEDVFSRCTPGFYLSLDPVGLLTTGMCLMRSILDKRAWLAGLGVEGEWPIFGVPGGLHFDNAKEFRSKALKLLCEQLDIELHFRKPGEPHWGGHIESLIKTLNLELHGLRGTTFSNVRQKGDYDPEKTACMTFEEAEKYIANFFVAYHHRKHDEIGIPPIDMYRRGIVGHGDQPGIGIPRQVTDERWLWLLGLPMLERTVQRYGIRLDGIDYWSDALRPWVDARERGNRRRFTIRRDPRDVSTIYFLDPKLDTYLEVPYRDTTRPAMSLWDQRTAIRLLRHDGKEVYEETIFRAYAEMNRIHEDAHEKTTTARRLTERRRHHALPKPAEQPRLPPPPPAPDFDEPILPDDDLEVR